MTTLRREAEKPRSPEAMSEINRGRESEAENVRRRGAEKLYIRALKEAEKRRSYQGDREGVRLPCRDTETVRYSETEEG